MTREELLLHTLQIALQLAIAIERISITQADKDKAKFLQDRLDAWLAIVAPKDQ